MIIQTSSKLSLSTSSINADVFFLAVLLVRATSIGAACALTLLNKLFCSITLYIASAACTTLVMISALLSRLCALLPLAPEDDALPAVLYSAGNPHCVAIIAPCWYIGFIVALSLLFTLDASRVATAFAVLFA